MAVGFPLKTTYANGDVYSASDVNDTNGTLNLLGQSVVTAAGKNAVINGGMDIWQRGTTFASPTQTYTADRWTTLIGATAPATTVSRQTTSDTTNLPTIQYCARVARNSGQTNTGNIYLSQSLESVNSTRFAGQKVTLSFWARKGANYSAASSLLLGELLSGTGTDQNVNSGLTGSSLVSAISATLTTTWQRFTFTGTVSATATQLGFYFYFTPVGTAGAADYFEVTGVQLEEGSVATPFSRAGGTIQGELAACQRYCFAVTSGATDRTTSQGAYYNSTTFVSTVAYPVTMRTVPSATIVTAANYWIIYANNTTDTADTASFGGAGLNAGNLEITGNVSGTTGHGGQLRTNNAAASVILSAEL
jgi:hypothetical protein